MLTRKARYLAVLVVALAVCPSPIAKIFAVLGIILCLFI